MAKQVCDLRPGKGMSIAQSNEHLRVGQQSAYTKKMAGTMDPTREHLNFEIGRGGVVKEVDKGTSIPSRIRSILKERGVVDPNAGLTEEDPRRRRTVANIILEGSRDIMRKLAFSDQEVSFEKGAENSHVTRDKAIEEWAQDMYRFMSRKYGEENIAAFVVHLDETLPHIHCTLLPITAKGKFSYNYFFGGNKEEGSKKFRELHDELAQVNAKYGLERGDSIELTGAKHKEYREWVMEQVDEQKKVLHSLNDEIRKANVKLKGLTTMIGHLEAEREQIKYQIEALREQYNIQDATEKEAFEALKRELDEKLEVINEKIADKKAKLEQAKEELKQLTKDKHDLQSSYDEQQRQLNRDLPKQYERVLRDADAVLWREASNQVRTEYAALQTFSKELPSVERKKMDEIMNGSFIEELAQQGNNIAVAAAMLYMGYIDKATTFAASNGGGGGSPGTGWGRDKDEDDLSYLRRCCIMGRMMMRPAGRKLKR